MSAYGKYSGLYLSNRSIEFATLFAASSETSPQENSDNVLTLKGSETNGKGTIDHVQEVRSKQASDPKDKRARLLDKEADDIIDLILDTYLELLDPTSDLTLLEGSSVLKLPKEIKLRSKDIETAESNWSGSTLTTGTSKLWSIRTSIKLKVTRHKSLRWWHGQNPDHTNNRARELPVTRKYPSIPISMAGKKGNIYGSENQSYPFKEIRERYIKGNFDENTMSKKAKRQALEQRMQNGIIKSRDYDNYATADDIIYIKNDVDTSFDAASEIPVKRSKSMRIRRMLSSKRIEPGK